MKNKQTTSSDTEKAHQHIKEMNDALSSFDEKSKTIDASGLGMLVGRVAPFIALAAIAGYTLNAEINNNQELDLQADKVVEQLIADSENQPLEAPIVDDAINPGSWTLVKGISVDAETFKRVSRDSSASLTSFGDGLDDGIGAIALPDDFHDEFVQTFSVVPGWGDIVNRENPNGAVQNFRLPANADTMEELKDKTVTVALSDPSVTAQARIVPSADGSGLYLQVDMPQEHSDVSLFVDVKDKITG